MRPHSRERIPHARLEQLIGSGHAVWFGPPSRLLFPHSVKML